MNLAKRDTLPGMKKLIFVGIIGLVSLAGAFAVKAYSDGARRGRQAAEQQQRRLDLQGKIDSDRLELRDAQLKEDIAQRKGQRVDTAASQIAQAKLDAAESQMKSVDQMDAYLATLK